MNQIFIFLAIISSLPQSISARKCTGNEQLEAISASHFFPVKIIKVSEVPAGKNEREVTVQWRTTTDLPENGKAGNKLILYFAPDEGAAEFSTTKGHLSDIGESRIYVSSSVGISSSYAEGVESGIILPKGRAYRIYASAIACDENNPVEIRKAGWMPWYSNDFSILSLPADEAKLESVTSGNDRKITTIRVEGFAPELNSYKLTINSDGGSRTIDVDFTSPQEFLKEYLQGYKLGSGSAYSGGSNPQWVYSTTNEVVNNLVLMVTNLETGEIKTLRSTPVRTSWVNDLVSGALETAGQELTDQQFAVLTASVWLEGKGFDGGRELNKFVKQYLPLHPDVLTNPEYVSQIVKWYPNRGYYPASSFRFPSTAEGEAFSQGYSKVEIQDYNFQSTGKNLATGFYLAWRGNVGFFSLSEDGKLSPIEDCRCIDCDEFPVPGRETPIVAPLSEKVLDNIIQRGLWVRNAENDEWFDDGLRLEDNTIPSRETWDLKIFRRTRTILSEVGRYSGFLDSRDLLNFPKIKIGYQQLQGLSPNIALPEVVGWSTPKVTPVFAARNPQMLRMPKSGIGVPGPPQIEAGSIKVDEFGLDEIAADETFLDVEAGARPGTIHLTPNSDAAEFDPAVLHHRTLEISKQSGASGPDQIVPLSYYVSPFVSTILISGRTGDADRETWGRFADAAAAFVERKYHHYVQVLDLNDWLLGRVYFQANGITVSEGSEKGELAVLLADARPLFSTTLPMGGLESLSHGFILSLNQGNAKKLGVIRDRINANQAGKLLNDVDWSNPQSLADMGFGITDPAEIKEISRKLQAWNDRNSPDNPIGVVNPSVLCYSTLAGGMDCFEPQFYQQNRQSIANAIHSVADIGLTLVPGFGDLYDVGRTTGDVQSGKISGAWGYSQVGLAALPVVPSFRALKDVGRAAESADEVYHAAKAASHAEELLAEVVEKTQKGLDALPSHNASRAVTSVFKIAEGETVLQASTRRGRLIEEMPWSIFGGQKARIIGEAPGNYPVIDHFDKVTGLAASIKSMDVLGYRPERFQARLNGFVKKMSDWNGYKPWAGVRRILPTEVKSRKLLLVLEKDALDDTKKDILRTVIINAKIRKNNPVEVVVEYL
ncbi:MAG: hypothetical protein IPN71_21590 [Fibrobacteres bacterium]|nr:hypothetical protein [Fibrobacterota bacterium]